jgi:cell division septal protein FtsQ
LTYRRNRKKSRKAPVVREIQVTRHRQLFLVFLFAVSQFFFLQSSMFVVRDVTVHGQKGVSETSIRKALDLGSGSRYWDLSADVLQANLLELNGLQSADVEVRFPGRVQVQVAERKPVFTAASIARSRHRFAVDADGLVLSAGQAPGGSLEIVVDRELKVGGRLSVTEMEVSNYLRAHLRPAVAQRLDRVSFDGRGDVSLRIKYRDAKIPVRLGRPEKLSYKLFLLEELLASLKAESADVVSIDLRFSTPIVRQSYQKPQSSEEAAPE